MKKYLFALSLLYFFCGTSFSQITIYDHQFMPIGKQFVFAYDSTPRSPGNSGANQIWNFSNLTNIYTDTFITTNPNWTPYSANFPGTNLTMISSNIMFNYFQNTPTAFYILGDIQQGNIPPNIGSYSPPQKFCKWPMTYLDSFSDSTVYNYLGTFTTTFGVDTFKIRQYIEEDNTVDAWGQITTPYGTFNSLRMKKMQTLIDTIWQYSAEFSSWTMIGPMTSQSVAYYWFSNSTAGGFIIAEIAGNPTTFQYYGTSWLKNSLTGQTEIITNEKIFFYPNPLTTSAILEIKEPSLTRNSSFSMYDVNGKLVMHLQALQENNTIVKGGLSSGIYFWQVKDEDVVLGKGKIIVE